MRIEGLEEFERELDYLATNLRSELQRIINKHGGQLLRTTKLRTPVDSGQLRRSWQSERGDLYYEVYNNTEYGLHIEYGHRTRSGSVVDGRYMLKRTYEEVSERFFNELEAILYQMSFRR